jgi:predicted nuclease of predicted toxin-antitoxin system
VKFLINSMLPPETVQLLRSAGHDVTTPAELGAHNLPDDVLIELSAADGRIIVTENASDFAAVTTCPVLFIRKEWWPAEALSTRLAEAIDRWAAANRQPGPWPRWLGAELR